LIAAQSAECANEQGKYWEYHDTLFEKQNDWNRLDSNSAISTFNQYASDIGLKNQQFDSCLGSGKYLEEVQGDLSDGRAYDITGTPGFFIGNQEIGFVKLNGAQPFESFKKIIDAQLSEKGIPKPAPEPELIPVPEPIPEQESEPELDQEHEPNKEPEPVPCQKGSHKEKKECLLDLYFDNLKVEISSFNEAKETFDDAALMLTVILGRFAMDSSDEFYEFAGEEKRERYEEVESELLDRNISLTSFSNLIYSSSLTDHEKSVMLEIIEDSLEFLKYKFAEILHDLDRVEMEINNRIKNSNLSNEEQSDVLRVFGSYVEKRKKEVLNVAINQITEIQSEVSMGESSETIGDDINRYYSDLKSEQSIKSIGGGGCLIATATYGSELSPQVQQLRELRDNKLLQTESGAAFMQGFNDFYYSFSPIIADYERENPVFKDFVKLVITPMISSLSILNYVDMETESEVLGYGISLILLNIGMYVGVPAIVVVEIRKKF